MSHEKQLENIIENHIPSIVAILLCIFICLAVPQFSNIFDLPSPFHVQGKDILITILFWLFVISTALWYIFILYFIVPKNIVSDPKSNRFFQIVAYIEKKLRSWYEFKNNKTVRILAFLLGITSISGFFVCLSIVESPYKRSVWISWLILSFFLSLWIWIAPDLSKKSKHPKILETLARITFFILLSSMMGELVWKLPDWIPSIASYRLYHIVAIIHSCAVLVMLAQFFELLGPKSKAAMLCFPLIFWSILPWVWQSPIVGKPLLTSEQNTAQQNNITKDWLEKFDGRIDAIPDGKPVVFIAAAGGGSRAALFTSLILEYFKRLPLSSQNTLLEEKKSDDSPKDQKYLSDCIGLISGVSGGSLASAYFIYPPHNRASTILNSIESELKIQTIEKIQERIKEIDQEIKSKEFDIAENLLQERKSNLEKIKIALEGHWVWENTFADDMNTNFMAPLLRGAFFLQGMERGESVTCFWENKFGWETKFNHNSHTSPTLPLAVFNSAIADQGIRFAVGFPPLLTAPDRLSKEKENQLSILSLSEYQPDYQLTLSQAVRLSANFPWGFEIPKLQTKDSTLFLIDGGVTDNTGMDTILEILKRIKAQSTKFSKARDILKKLQYRGIYIIEIDSGAKPHLTKDADQINPVTGPWNALNIASYKNSILTQRSRYEEIEKIVQKVRIIPFTNPGHVMTAWALGPNDKAETILDFLEESERFLKTITSPEKFPDEKKGIYHFIKDRINPAKFMRKRR